MSVAEKVIIRTGEVNASKIISLSSPGSDARKVIGVTEGDARQVVVVNDGEHAEKVYFISGGPSVGGQYFGSWFFRPMNYFGTDYWSM